eukprot:PITA_15605
MLISKYVQKVPFRSIQIAQTNNSSQIWKLCSKTLNFFIRKAYKIPGNDKHTNLWHDRIMDRDPLAEFDEIAELRIWLERAGINSLYDLSNWDCHDDWQGWDFFGVPERLNQQKCALEELLEEAAPVNRKMKDTWGWGRSGSYTTAAAYNALQPNRNCSKLPDFWKKVWEPLALPKVNLFFWMLVYNKLLTGDNLMKKTIAGPHSWSYLEVAQKQPSTSLWNASLPKNKSFWRKVSNAIPKFVCWQIWLTRNDLIFNEKLQAPFSTAVKAKSLLLEAAQQQYFSEDSLLLSEEERWLGPLSPHPRKQISAPHAVNPEWGKRDSKANIQEWWQKQKITTIFFDGASKGNPGTVGARGVIYAPDSSRRDSFRWGIKLKTNNQAEIQGLLKACQIARDRGDKEFQAFGESEILIKNLNTGKLFNNASLNKSLNRLKRVLLDFNSYKFLHILRSLNSEADLMANKGCTLGKGQLLINDESSFHPSNP